LRRFVGALMVFAGHGVWLCADEVAGTGGWCRVITLLGDRWLDRRWRGDIFPIMCCPATQGHRRQPQSRCETCYPCQLLHAGNLHENTSTGYNAMQSMADQAAYSIYSRKQAVEYPRPVSFMPEPLHHA